ncbi:MAG: adenylate/guanylate cyclase domain-containing protein [Candidatus Promineifilaceae bacterium]|nr:adenylate/guanylate cyclase domain-containing protein [Candidatus Promineifilaceae bacterium]
MPKPLSDKDQKMKEFMERNLGSPDVTWMARSRRLFGMLPSDPRCSACGAPFEGKGSTLVRVLLNKKRSQYNPLFCNHCEELARKTHAGAEVTMSMLFADIRGSTPLAESMSAADFQRLIDRFYRKSTHVLIHSLAQVDKLAGDQVSGYYLPSYVGRDHARVAVEAAQKLLHVTGHADPEGAWAPVGVGINTGVAYFGTVGREGDMIDITALGDEVNIAARLASTAAAGEIVLSESTVSGAALDASALEKRTLALKGKSEPMDVWVMAVTPGAPTT